METLTSRVPLEWGVAALAMGGQTVSGDQHLVQMIPDGAVVAALDGLGHGQEAAEAASLCVATLGAFAQAPLAEAVRRCHEALTQTRGVVMSVARFSESEDTMTWLGVGNVTGLLIRGSGAEPPREILVPRAGVVGYQLPSVAPATLRVQPGDALIFATDGLDSSFVERGAWPSESPRRLAARLLAKYGKETDDALVLAARWKRRTGNR